MPQDAFTLRHLTRELNALFVGGKISKINQPAKDRLSLLIYTRSGTVKLDIDLSARFCRVSVGETNAAPNPVVAPNFCMLLRKHLQNAEITAVAQVGFERVLYFDFLCFSEFETCAMRLYLEIMGKYSNAVLTRDGVIVGALKTTSLESAKRVTFGGAKYVLPEKQGKADPTDLQALEKAFAEKSGDAAKFLSERIAGLAYTTAVEMVGEYGENISAEQVYDYVGRVEISPCVAYLDGVAQDFKARSLTAARKEFPTLLQAQAAFYDEAIAKNNFSDEKRKLTSALSSAVKKAEKRLGQIGEKLLECAQADEIRLKGELITANIYAVERGAEKFEAVNYYDEKGGTVSIALDARLTPSQNAQRYYKKYAKLKRTAENLTGQKAEAERRLAYLLTISDSIAAAEDASDLAEIRQELCSLSLLPEPKTSGKKIKDVRVPYRRYTFGKHTVLCGRNNVQNDRLTKSLSESDVWLHVKGFHSSHVAVLTEGGAADDQAVKFAAEICAYYSAAREKDKVAVDYTLKKFVKKPNGSPTGFAVYTDFKTINVAPNAHTEERKDE